MPDHRLEPGRSFVTRRAIVDLVRAATLGSYGVVGLGGSRLERVLGRLGLATPGIRVRLPNPFSVHLELVVAYGLPVAEVARQAESAVRYALRTAVGREPDALAIRVAGLRAEPPRPAALHVAPSAGRHPSAAGVAPDDMAVEPHGRDAA